MDSITLFVTGALQMAAYTALWALLLLCGIFGACKLLGKS